MTRITNSEQILLLLKAELQKTERTEKAKGKSRNAKTDRLVKGPLNRLPGVLSEASLSDREKHRLLISAILTNAFGEKALNDPSLQSIIDKVTDQMHADDDLRTDLDAALTELASQR